MQDMDATIDDASLKAADREAVAERVGEVLRLLFKKFILFVSFGPGVLGFVWLLGKIFRR
jgi:hypothetical protein